MALPMTKRLRIFMRDDYTCRYCGYDMTLHFAYPHLRVLTHRKGNLGIEEFLRDLHATAWPVVSALRDAEQRDGRA